MNTKKLVQIGVQSLRGPDGNFLPSEPIYREMTDDEAKKAAAREEKMLDEGASDIARAMKRYKERFFWRGGGRMSKLTEAQKNKRYRQMKKYKVICKLLSADRYCKKYDGAPCCFFCKDKQKCESACQNEPIGCNCSACKYKNGGVKVERALQGLRTQTTVDK